MNVVSPMTVYNMNLVTLMTVCNMNVVTPMDRICVMKAVLPMPEIVT